MMAVGMLAVVHQSGGMEMVTSSSGEMNMAIPTSLGSGDGQPHDLKVQVAVPYLSRWKWSSPIFSAGGGGGHTIIC